ncbi:methionyl-tRNA formyltransferase [Atopococcus tabaci]|uniref:methionyl-tRNA formyltransferase n=1 Tax=Atopococcus tabaci TaxID=269774 RepID=UPI000419BE67|nr:methionyl-tRNA formyltransferase [Atopococcus tabaci]
MTKIVFMGTPQFSVPILEALVENDFNVVAVVTQPDRPVGRKRVLTPTPVKQAAERLGLPVLRPEKISGSEEMDTILEMKPDLIVTAAFGQFLPTKLLEAPTHGSINVHASLLPKYRGGAPIHHALINGEKETGVTIMYMVKKMDAGPIISQRALPITTEDDTGILFDKLSLLGRDLLIDTLPDLLAGKLTPVPQDEAQATYSPNITREEEQIDWSLSAQQIDWKVRGMRPFPGAYTLLDGKRLKIWGVSIASHQTKEAPGTIIEKTKEELAVACGQGSVVTIDMLQPSGKGKMPVRDFLAGAGSHLKEGQKLGE